MARAKKSKRADRAVVYVRMSPEEHEQITAIARGLGWPHTIASVVCGMIRKCLKEEQPEAAKEAV